MIVFLTDVELAADDRLYAGGFGGVIKIGGAENISVIGDGHRRHAQLASASDQLVDVTSAIQQRIICMQMQMDKLRHEGLPLF